MPYIKKFKRLNWMDLGLKDLLRAIDEKTEAGELNYIISMILLRAAKGKGAGRKNYKRLNDVMGAIENAKLEFYRMIVAPYEDKKRNENGPIEEEEGIY